MHGGVDLAQQAAMASKVCIVSLCRFIWQGGRLGSKALCEAKFGSEEIELVCVWQCIYHVVLQ